MTNIARLTGYAFEADSIRTPSAIVGSAASTIDPGNGCALDVQAGAIYTQGALGFYASAAADPSLALYRGGTDFLVVRNYSQEYTILYLWAPPGTRGAGNREATFTLQRGDDSDGNGVEFLDIFNNGYNTPSPDFSFGIRVQARAPGALRPFYIQHSTVANVVTNLMTFAANGDVTIHSTGITNALKVDGTTGDVSLGGKFGCNGATPQGKYASGGLLAGVVTALINNGTLSS